ncbi:19616_t:CDS:2, partial [Racocetra fulgida]
KTNEFKENLDENNVIKNMRNLLNSQNSQNLPNLPEMVFSETTVRIFDNVPPPPAYDIKANNSDLSSEDYAKWKLAEKSRSRRNDDWDGFVMAIPGGYSAPNGGSESEKYVYFNNQHDVERVDYRNSN